MSAIRRWLLGALIGGLLAVPSVHAHDARAAYLEITENAHGRFDVLWRVPVRPGVPPPQLSVRWPDGTRELSAPAPARLADSIVERRLIEITGGLAGRRIEFAGLQETAIDVLARVQRLDGTVSTSFIQRSESSLQFAEVAGALHTFATYLRHGIEHILLGYDHLLFVLALLLLVRNVRTLVWTITAFTVAHSITLALATLEAVRVPGPPVEAAIALSILLLAAEIVRVRRGAPSLTARRPWIVAFGFGLLHGFGFAGALSEIGLPKGDIPLALFAFNAGVEIGQLGFVGAVVGARLIGDRLAVLQRYRHRALTAVSYVIGSLAAFWLFARLATFAG